MSLQEIKAAWDAVKILCMDAVLGLSEMEQAGALVERMGLDAAIVYAERFASPEWTTEVYWSKTLSILQSCR